VVYFGAGGVSVLRVFKKKTPAEMPALQIDC
jgi:hypothetical protein